MDPLDEVFSAMQVQNAMYVRLEASAPWGLHTRQRDSTALFGLIVCGGAWLSVDEVAIKGVPIALAAGDCFLIPCGHSYTLRDSLTSDTISCGDVIRESVGGTAKIGGGGAHSTIISGSFNFDPFGASPLMEILPALLHIRMDQERTQLLQATLHLLALETARHDLGSGLVVSRLADIIFVQAVRAYVATLGADKETGWLAALSDRHIGAALQLLHKDVSVNWTVGMLASACNMSRSGFALRFKEKLGQSPVDYLTRWRMFRASHWLRKTDRSLMEIASSVGYESEAAFNKAFKRSIGLAPGAFRKRAISQEP